MARHIWPRPVQGRALSCTWAGKWSSLIASCTALEIFLTFLNGWIKINSKQKKAAFSCLIFKIYTGRNPKWVVCVIVASGLVGQILKKMSCQCTLTRPFSLTQQRKGDPYRVLVLVIFNKYNEEMWEWIARLFMSLLMRKCEQCYDNHVWPIMQHNILPIQWWYLTWYLKCRTQIWSAKH